MHPPAPDAVERVSLLPAPRGQEETTRCGVFLPVEGLKERNQLVPMGKNSIRILRQNLAQLLVGRVVGYVAPLNRGLRLGNIKRDFGVRVLLQLSLGLGLGRVLPQLPFIKCFAVSTASASYFSRAFTSNR